MARIYDAQIQWQAPTAHRFQAQPLKDYISDGLANLSKAAGVASEGIQKIKDQEAAAKMEKAGQAAKDYIDNFEDFSGDNYMDVMQANAMKFWDSAFGSLDSATQTRFDSNNPEARNIFEMKAREAAVNKTFDHQAQEWTRRVPVISSQIVARGTPNGIKKSLVDTMNDIYQNSGMRAEDAEKVVDAVRLAVADGAIAQAIGEGRLSDAAALNNDLDFSSALTPARRAQNNITIQNAIKSQQEAKKELSLDKKREAVVDALVLGGVNLYDQMYAMAGQDTAAREQITTSYNKFLSDFLNGNIKDEYNGVLVSDVFPEIRIYTDAPFSVRQEVVKKIVGKTLENNPTDQKIKAELGYRIATLSARLPTDDDGNVDFSSVKPEDMAEVFRVLDQVSGYYSFDDGIQKEIGKLVQIRTAYSDRASLALKHSAFQDRTTLINQKTGLGWETQKYMQSGNLSPDTMDALRTGRLAQQKGVLFDAQYREAMLDAMQNFAYFANGGKLPESGTYEELAMMEVVALAYASDEDKRALGIENVTEEQFVESWLRNIDYFDSLGVLKTQVPDEVETDSLGQVIKYLPGSQALLETVAPQVVYANNKAYGKPIKETPWYQSMLATIKELNGGANPDEKVLESFASANRATQFKYWMDRMNYMKMSNTARPAVKSSRANKNPTNASAAPIKVK